MDELSKDFLLDQSMTSIASFKEASTLSKRALKEGGKDKKGLSPSFVLEKLLDFIDEESNRVFNEYHESSGHLPVSVLDSKTEKFNQKIKA